MSFKSQNFNFSNDGYHSYETTDTALILQIIQLK